MLDPTLKQQLASHLQRLQLDIELDASLDDSPASAELDTLLAEIAALSRRITVRRSDTDPRRPSFAIRRTGTDVAVRFAGVPLGHEFTSLVLALLQVGGHPPKIAPATLERVRALSGEFRFETFFSLSCQNCPDVVQALNAMSIVNPAVQHVAIDGARFQDEVDARQIMAVPAVYLNGEVFAHGRMDLEEILAKLDSTGAAAAARQLAEREPYDVLIVGGGPAGAAAAIYAARKGIRTGVVAERFGGQVLDTLGIENLISVTSTQGPRLAAALEEHAREYVTDIETRQSATALVPAASAGGLHAVQLASGARLRARAVVLATGARWRTLDVPGEDEYRNRGVAYCPHCDGPLFRGKRVAVVGGGNSGVEAAVDLAGIAAHVTLLEFDSKLRADAVLQRKLASLSNVAVHLNARTTEVVGDGSRVTGLRWRDRATEGERHADLEGVFVQIGLLPNTAWLEGTVQLTPRGEIVIDDRGATSVPGVYAAGDVTTVTYKQIVIAMGAGSTAALAAFDYLMRSSAPAEPVATPAPPPAAVAA